VSAKTGAGVEEAFLDVVWAVLKSPVAPPMRFTPTGEATPRVLLDGDGKEVDRCVC
jgi:hypothetical protein